MLNRRDPSKTKYLRKLESKKMKQKKRIKVEGFQGNLYVQRLAFSLIKISYFLIHSEIIVSLITKVT